MNQDTSNPNIEWKKSGFEPSERPSLRVDAEKAIEHEIKDKKNVQKSYSPIPAVSSPELNKIRKKIREVYDDEDEDENDYQIVGVPALEQVDNSLMNALNADEKRILQQQESSQQNKLLEDESKMEALNKANRFIKEAKIKDVRKEDILKNIQDSNPSGKDIAFEAIKENIRKNTDIKVGKNIKDKDLINLAKGIERVKKVAGEENLKEINARVVTRIGIKDANDKEVAEMILDKSGRKDVKKKPKKALDKMNVNKKDRKALEKKLQEENKLQKEELSR